MHQEINQSYYWSYLILCLHNIDTLNICVKKFYAKKNNFWQNDSFVNLAIFFHVCLFCFCLVHTWESQLIPELLLKLSNTLLIQTDILSMCMKRCHAKKITFQQNGCLSNLAILYDVYRQCICEEFNLYHSLCRNISILCLLSIDSLNICMKKFDAKKYQNNSFVKLAVFSPPICL